MRMGDETTDTLDVGSDSLDNRADMLNVGFDSLDDASDTLDDRADMIGKWPLPSDSCADWLDSGGRLADGPAGVLDRMSDRRNKQAHPLDDVSRAGGWLNLKVRKGNDLPRHIIPPRSILERQSFSRLMGIIKKLAEAGRALGSGVITKSQSFCLSQAWRKASVLTEIGGVALRPVTSFIMPETK